LPIVPHIKILHIKADTKPGCWLNFFEPRLMESHPAVIIPFDYRIIFVRLLNRAQSPVGFPKSPKPSTRSPGFSSTLLAEGLASRGFLARSASGVAPEYDSGG